MAETPAQTSAQLAPFAAPGQTAPAPPWSFDGFPESYGKNPTRFDVTEGGATQTLKISADNAYGMLVHPWHGPAPGLLAWRWRLQAGLPAADIHAKAGDDSALKVCVMFDQPPGEIPFLERAALKFARATSGKDLPAATLCYLWDAKYPEGSTGVNAYTARLRYIVLRGPHAALGQWLDERRDVSDDFQKTFGAESPRTPPVTAVAVGADSDNTHGSSVGFIAGLHWLRPVGRQAP